ncbi:MAG TPA: hypothetical protein QGI07_05540 [Dehalococcoidia bacterium]|jgi:MFS family permease|nr:hypothetical protein [Dehalococcoidia bacterium]MDP7160072.1 hypothetical protein [Dehalococcoidia bacterium]MDP7212310.1 hypothetical protein [Dehalococcoidia bacterium]MDP7513893.1 hypothetical protein [Dehalococcoidia bacterium]HJM53470.1 hypothetical protein [Dehalococcoidia bacterium]|tara:strand:+ start:106 stop:414 length:309 start_codon:yes stop_codon:yes gene_type:complete
MVGFAFSRSYPLSIGILFFMGKAAALSENLVTTLVQTMASDETRGRVMSVLRMADSLNPVGMILGGLLTAAFTNEIALILGAGMAFGAVALAIGLSRSARGL